MLSGKIEGIILLWNKLHTNLYNSLEITGTVIQDVPVQTKHQDPESNLKDLAGIGETDPGFVKIEPNQVVMETADYRESGK